MKPNVIILLAVTAMLAGGCLVGPDYQKPAARTPSTWSEPLAGGETNGVNGLTTWWHSFDDRELDSLVERAAKSNLDLRVAEARLHEARAVYGGARASLLPTADVSASMAREGASRNQAVLGSLPIPPGVSFENNVYQAGVDASWEIDVFGGKRRAIESARAGLGSAVEAKRAVLTSLLGDVARSYVELRGDQRRIVIAQENIEAQTKALGITRDRFNQGLSSDLDVQQAATLLATTTASVPSLETAVKVAAHRIEVLLGEPVGSLQNELGVSAAIPSNPPQVPVGLASELLLRRPDVRRAERELAAATANIDVARADLFPKFYLTGVAGFQSVSAGDWFTAGSRFWSVGPSVQWRIFDAGQIRANIKVQNARQEAALAGYERTVLEAFEEVENSLVAYAKEQVRRQSLAEAVAASRKSLETANQLYASGLTDFLHVLDAERSFYQAEDALAVSDQTVSANLVVLYKALGGGWEAAEGKGELALISTTGK